MKEQHDEFTHIKAKFKKDQIRECCNCPYKIYNKTNDLYYGIGNLSPKYIFVLPIYDYSISNKENNSFVLLKELCDEILGYDSLTVIYVTRVVKCKPSYDTRNMFNIGVINCRSLLIRELKRLPIIPIVLFGTVRDLITCTDRIVYKVYDPNVLIYGTEYQKIKLKQQLTKILCQQI